MFGNGGGTPSYVRPMGDLALAGDAEQALAGPAPFGTRTGPVAPEQPSYAGFDWSKLIAAGKAVGAGTKNVLSDEEARSALIDITGASASIVRARREAKVAANAAIAQQKSDEYAAKLAAQAQADAIRSAGIGQGQASIAAAQSRGTLIAVGLAGGFAVLALLLLKPPKAAAPRVPPAVARNRRRKRRRSRR